MIFFRTPRLIFRTFETVDLDALAALSADAEVSRYVGNGKPLSRETTRQWIDNSRANVARYGYGTGAIEDERGDLIGWGGIARPEGGEEIIYGFAKQCWGSGLGTEFLAGLVDWALTLELNLLRATVDARNSASIAMLRRQGFELLDGCWEGEAGVHLYVLDTAARVERVIGGLSGEDDQ